MKHYCKFPGCYRPDCPHELARPMGEHTYSWRGFWAVLHPMYVCVAWESVGIAFMRDASGRWRKV